MKRSDNVARLPEAFDVLVIGAGATGLGVAIDSTSRGYSTLVVDQRDLAHGTSSRSTNLVHGGVRYLQQGNISLVRQALRERGLLLKNAPHIVSELRFLVPSYELWSRPFYGMGLKAYDLMAGSLGLTSTRIVGARTAEDLVPTIRPDKLRGGVLYSDGQFNDSRLAISMARTANRLGAALVNYAGVSDLLKTAGKVSGAVVADLETGSEFAVRARVVVNATGVFTDAIRRMDDPSAERIVATSQGSHIVLPRSFLPGETALMVPRTKDGRVCFLIPWEGRVLLGTTDIPVPGATAEPVAVDSEIDFLLDCAAQYLRKEPSRDDILSVFSGLRPLVRGSTDKTSALSRDHTLVVSDSGLVTITGGKWTTYRHMAEHTVDRLAAVAGLPRFECRTRDLQLDGADAKDSPWAQFGVEASRIHQYDQRYTGTLHPALPYSMAMVGYVVEEEMPVRLEDVLVRRLRALQSDAGAALEAAPKVAALMATIQGRSQHWVQNELSQFGQLAASAMARQETRRTRESPHAHH
jgi:glycerol-3-phosphate dehydrogenase